MEAGNSLCNVSAVKGDRNAYRLTGIGGQASEGDVENALSADECLKSGLGGGKLIVILYKGFFNVRKGVVCGSCRLNRRPVGGGNRSGQRIDKSCSSLIIVIVEVYAYIIDPLCMGSAVVGTAPVLEAGNVGIIKVFSDHRRSGGNGSEGSSVGGKSNCNLINIELHYLGNKLGVIHNGIFAVENLLESKGCGISAAEEQQRFLGRLCKDSVVVRSNIKAEGFYSGYINMIDRCAPADTAAEMVLKASGALGLDFGICFGIFSVAQREGPPTAAVIAVVEHNGKFFGIGDILGSGNSSVKLSLYGILDLSLLRIGEGIICNACKGNGYSVTGGYGFGKGVYFSADIRNSGVNRLAGYVGDNIVKPLHVISAVSGAAPEIESGNIGYVKVFTGGNGGGGDGSEGLVALAVAGADGGDIKSHNLRGINFIKLLIANIIGSAEEVEGYVCGAGKSLGGVGSKVEGDRLDSGKVKTCDGSALAEAAALRGADRAGSFGLFLGGHRNTVTRIGRPTVGTVTVVKHYPCGTRVSRKRARRENTYNHHQRQ